MHNIEYFLTEKQQVKSKVFPVDIKDVSRVEQNRIDFKDLKGSLNTNFSPLIFKMPPENQKELNEIGYTEYMVVTTTTIIVKQNIY